MFGVRPYLQYEFGPVAFLRRLFTNAATGTAAPIVSDATSALHEAQRSVAEGRLAGALQIVSRALERAPHEPALLLQRASTLFAWGRFHEAYAAAQLAEQSGVHNLELYLTLGWSSLAGTNSIEAEKWMRKAVAVEAESWSAHFGLASVFKAAKRLDEAAASLERALAIDPRNIDCLMTLMVVRLDQAKLDEAEWVARMAIDIDPRRAVPWANLGISLARRDRQAEALLPFQRAGEMEANASEACDSFVNYANCLRESGRTFEALALYEANLISRPSLDGIGDYALGLLTAGRFEEGWHYYECRWIRDPLLSMRPAFHSPMWAGQDLRGKTIVLHAEQGFGDIIQFVRYAPLLKAMGASVVLHVRAGLGNLTKGMPGLDTVVDRETAPPPFDYYVNLLSLPRVFGTEVETIPCEVPYVHADAALADAWARRLEGLDGLRVGLVWAGNPNHVRDRHRSLPLSVLAPLLEASGVRWLSLQKGAATAELAQLQSNIAVLDAGADLNDFADTAALISQLDLVICVDTAVAHLAGALSKPVWLLLPQVADFRWLEGRDDSPWYPTMRLFRQARAGDWPEVVARVGAALQAWIATGQAKLTPERRPAQSTPTPPVRVPGVVRGHRPGMSAVAETRLGIVQYLPDEPDEGVSIGWYGEYLQLQLDRLVSLVRPGATVMEVGAGVGMHALHLARALGATGHLFLYEARPVVQRILRQNLAANRIANVSVMRHALRGCAGGPGLRAGEVRSETLDELQLDRLDWLKLNAAADVIDVLAGGEQTLWRLRPLLFIDATKQAQLDALAERVHGFGYRRWQTEVPLFNPDNFNRRDTDLFGGRRTTAWLAIPEEIDVDIPLEGWHEIARRNAQ